MEELLNLCQTAVVSSKNSAHLQQELSEKVLEVAQTHQLDLSRPENLFVGSYNPLCEACFKGNLEVIQTFVSHGASLNFLDSEGRSPLYHAISGFNNTNQNIRQLLEWGADVNLHKHGRCPLLVSLYSMRHETAKMLIRHGADVNNVILPSFYFVETVFALNPHLVMMASGVRFHLENFADHISLALQIVMAGLAPRTFYLCGKRFLLKGFTAKELSDLWSFQHLCLVLGFKIEPNSLKEAINELRSSLDEELDGQQVEMLRGRLDILCWSQAFLASPLSLTYLTRIAIRGHLVQPRVCRGRHLSDNIARLPIPDVCKNFLNLKQCTTNIAEHMT